MAEPKVFSAVKLDEMRDLAEYMEQYRLSDPHIGADDCDLIVAALRAAMTLTSQEQKRDLEQKWSNEARTGDLAQASSERNATLEEAARVAEHGCLVPPDGGSPTKHIRAIPQEPVAWRWRAAGWLHWVYDPTPEWREEHKNDDDVEIRPLYANPHFNDLPQTSAATEDAEMRADLAKRVETGTRLFAMSDAERDLVVRLLRDVPQASRAPDGWMWRDYTGRPQIGWHHPGSMAEDPTPLYSSPVSRPTSEPQTAPAWRCFHCDEIFTDQEAALIHFGDDLSAQPGCKLNALEGGLLKIVRDQEEELRQFRREETTSYREFYALGADHRQALIREEQKGYDKGLADGRSSSLSRPDEPQHGFPPEACEYLPAAIDNAITALVGAREDLLAEVMRLRDQPQEPGVFDAWFDGRFPDPDGGTLPNGFKDDLRSAWNAALALSRPHQKTEEGNK